MAVVQEAYVGGLSTRDVDDLVKSMGMTGISKSQVSRLCSELDERVGAFLSRPLEGDWPYLWLDATYVRSRNAGRVVNVAIVVAVAVNREGRREVLGIGVMPSEAEAFWAEFLRSLTHRGLRGVQLVVSDAHVGLKAAAAKVLGASWQRRPPTNQPHPLPRRVRAEQPPSRTHHPDPTPTERGPRPGGQH